MMTLSVCVMKAIFYINGTIVYMNPNLLLLNSFIQKQGMISCKRKIINQKVKDTCDKLSASP